MSQLFSKALNNVPTETKRFVDLSFDIVDQIHEFLQRKNMSQKDLADLMGKKESEISKWMRGTHNFTIKSIANIEKVLGEEILVTSQKSKPKLQFIKVVVHKNVITKNSVFNATKVSPFDNGLKSA